MLNNFLHLNHVQFMIASKVNLILIEGKFALYQKISFKVIVINLNFINFINFIIGFIINFIINFIQFAGCKAIKFLF